MFNTEYLLIKLSWFISNISMISANESQEMEKDTYVSNNAVYKE